MRIIKVSDDGCMYGTWDPGYTDDRGTGALNAGWNALLLERG